MPKINSDESSSTGETGEDRSIEMKSYVYTSQATLAQVFATLTVSLSYISNFALIAINTVVVGNILNSTRDGVSLNEEQASWFGSLPALMHPVGLLLGIVFQDYIGQRYNLMIANMMALIALIFLYYARTVGIIFIFAVLMGLSHGLISMCGVGYVGEFSETEFRGFLCSLLASIGCTGELFQYAVASMVHWRISALFASMIPILGIFFLFLIPDSPVWLLSKGKSKEAFKALAWFRGWVTKKDAQEEFNDLQTFVRRSLSHEDETVKVAGSNFVEGSIQSDGALDLMKAMLEKRTLYPLFLISFYVLTYCLASSVATGHYIINLLHALKIPIDYNWLTIPVGVAGLVGNVTLTLVIQRSSKRVLTSISLGSAAVISMLLGFYVHYKDALQLPWIFPGLYIVLKFISVLAQTIPWLLAAEVFPIRTRFAGAGVAGTMCSFVVFIFIKIYFLVNNILGPDLYFILNGVFGILGCVYLYFHLPETEGKSFAEIEEFFQKKI